MTIPRKIKRRELTVAPIHMLIVGLRTIIARISLKTAQPWSRLSSLKRADATSCGTLYRSELIALRDDRAEVRKAKNQVEGHQ